ncbi:ABC transporter permease subunit [Lactococcus raffinolactis]|jgi:His/Glu/Gln/Arg/opine family amino acid ABC transporter permease subunit|uniref:amino acid ABC transporter permease n=1 Tax=Pseudolactococcus raffinolactis TaxID=1366 RepID=UPI000BB48C92|nr:amino acid ABC transporter permease [Lactococcus raffinolactis]MDN6069997.1 amino acid ABC transporter permease [Lactococcus plantarum]ATC60992.1 arginine ABC transporter permease [Lactococcus raffinolactis]MBW9331760.1 amino acid ABC transporter permease [Lactococcus raffinolactis]MDG4962601.1 amino acid ABC transporter permease [Lactococcus raffinolactis]MDN5473019.1 amino acid ABC transporter permease [Lactococcus raffinolactis]
MTFIKNYGDFLWQGTLITVILSVVAMILATIIASVIVAGKLSKNKLISGGTTVIIELIRGLPTLCILFLCFYGLPELVSGQFMGIDNGRLVSGLIGLTIAESVFVAEIIRAGIQSVDSGQMEGARSIGFSKLASYRYIVLPQAIRNILPTMGNEFANIIKSSSQVSVIGIADLMFTSQKIQGISYKPFQAVIAVSIIYLIFSVSITQVVAFAERRGKTKRLVI